MNEKLKNTCINEFDPSAISTENALKRISRLIKPIHANEVVSLKNSINRISAENIKSTINIPSFKNSAMDGYAINLNDSVFKKQRILKEVGISYAGKPYIKKLNKGETVRVMTGALIPNNANAVIMQEMVKKIENQITFPKNIKLHQNIRDIGEDIKKSETIIQKGRRLNYADLGIISSVGKKYIKVVKKPKIGFLSTGDELVTVGKKLKNGQLYDSNRYVLHGLLSQLPINIKDYGVVKDNKINLEKKLLLASKECNLIITTGGVSVGDADYVREILHKIGKINFWKISIKPGRPLAFGKVKNSIFFGLPGNPVSVVVTFQLFVIAAIKKMMKQSHRDKFTIKAQTKSKLSKKKGRVEFQRAIFNQKNGNFYVQSTGSQGSNLLKSLSQANCYIKLDENIDVVNAGDIVEIIPFSTSI
ncbi:MAG: molybdopterin molybdenumtransferase MoeA [Gammaproteobacteria bacterium]|nr:molybdopterin molybdenumtransferase MoeA [Gammaproteobacteria bacterium]|tara:strand:- start:174367 stop:175623 length:1257 start_codon:yes stop_codon:yes gene_type:complete